MAGKRRCWKCSKVAEIEGMRYDRAGKDLICPECLKAEKRGTANATKATATNKFQPGNRKDDSISGSDEESTTISYQCGSCGLGFPEKKGARTKCCPYCGKGNFRVAFRDSAQKLIEESAKEPFAD